MIFSALTGMYSEADSYLEKGGLSSEAAAFALIGLFLAGVVGITIVSHFLHHYIPSRVVDCDHTHEELEDTESSPDEPHQNGHAHGENGHASEHTPLLFREDPDFKSNGGRRSRSATAETTQRPNAPLLLAPPSRRPSLHTRLTTRVSTMMTNAKISCDEGGPCHGYSDPCGQECLKNLSRSPTRVLNRLSVPSVQRQPTLLRSTTTPYSRGVPVLLKDVDEESQSSSPGLGSRRQAENSNQPAERGRTGHDHENHDHKRLRGISSTSRGMPPNDTSQSHHHHVPTNAFLSIGLQTSIAIALHKLPEGFITYATNHANPKLGFAVFLALFIHNITEGFAMALPLYLALGSRIKAMFWSSLLGGISQPMGAGVAALWFKVAGKSGKSPDEGIYGGMFAVTAGIMASVALHLLMEGLSLTHNRGLCLTFAFVGMGILGISKALTA